MPTTIHEALTDEGIRPPSGRAFWRDGNGKTVCPKCSETRKNKTDPCLSVTVTEEGANAKAVWNCHNCQWRGFTGVGRYAKVRDGVPRKVYRRPEITVVPPQQMVVDWFASRGIPDWLIRQEGIFGVKVWMPKAGEKVPAIAFPFRKNGEIVNVKYRDPVRKDFRQEKDAEPVPYGLDSIHGAKEIVIVEGEPDRLSCILAGKPAVISVPDGAPAKPLPEGSTKMDWWEACHADVEAAERIIVATDGDGPGRVLAQEIIRRAGRHKCYVVEWPAGTKDANELLLLEGPEELLKALDTARPVPVDGEVTVQDAWDAVEQLHAQERVEWFSTGFECLDPNYRVLLGQITVVTGWPHEGKSSFIDQIMVNLALNEGWRFAIFSPETPVETHIINLLEKVAQAPFFAGPSPRMPIETVRAFKDFLADRFHFVKWERKKGRAGRPTAEWLEDQIGYMVRRYGIRGFLLDPYNRIQPSAQARSETDFVAELLDSLQAVAKRDRLHGWVVAHPAKQQKDKNGKRPDRLALQDISGSANFDNMTDMGLLVRRIWINEVTKEPYPLRETPVEIECLKARNKHSGRKGGRATFRMRWSDGTFHPLTDANNVWI